MTPQQLIESLGEKFEAFDRIIKKFHLEKIKTIGDSYMCVGGLPVQNRTHAVDAVLAGSAMIDYLKNTPPEKEPARPWEIRIGIHSGQLIAGIIGNFRFAYDVWGDTVNVASRMERSGVSGRVNISRSTYDLIKDLFDCERRGLVKVKNKGEMEMFLVTGIKLSLHNEGVPNEKFWAMYEELKQLPE
ncbi:adenylate/guanylate cyclase domain-containing protein [candidate division CSSED10-310 bacterium]|uniref:Adenylate/guanylate cyclase domain-containing protein n=1 Tax=candidate division CSSED10-310 bacterium TaxID=2855610 RepID=A0ABV6YZC5_UNCC1